MRAMAALMLFASTSVTLHAQDLRAELVARLDSTIDAVLARTGVKGATAAIITPEGAWKGVAGISDETTPVDPAMLFAMGSITKTFTAATILQLVSEGRLALGDTIGTWISGYANINGRVTVRQLLAHTSGLNSFTDNEAFWAFTGEDLERFITPEDVLQFVGRPHFSPGFGWRYCNTGYTLLGMIIERVTGRAYDEVIAERHLAPLGLTSIAMGYDDTLPGVLAGNWTNIDDIGELDDMRTLPRRAFYSGAWAAGGLVTTAEHIARWGRALYGGDVLTPAMRDSMTTFRSIPGLGPNGGYGLGIMRATVAGQLAWGHGGDIPAFSSILWHFPAKGVTVAVLVNQNDDAPAIIAEALAAVVFGDAPAAVGDVEVPTVLDLR
jgi:D-alanyl-D-alanine carboxypeptidase